MDLSVEFKKLIKRKNSSKITLGEIKTEIKLYDKIKSIREISINSLSPVRNV